jgi:hypothetical protein
MPLRSSAPPAHARRRPAFVVATATERRRDAVAGHRFALPAVHELRRPLDVRPDARTW